MNQVAVLLLIIVSYRRSAIVVSQWFTWRDYGLSSLVSRTGWRNSTKQIDSSVFARTILNSTWALNLGQSQSQSHITTDSQSVSKSCCRAPSGAHDQIFITIWQLRSCFCWAPSLSRGRVCLFYMLLALASAVFLGSESLGTRDYILLSQIWDFPFCRLLRLAGSRWRYSTPPPHGYHTG
jgi:hypothetical protein